LRRESLLHYAAALCVVTATVAICFRQEEVKEWEPLPATPPLKQGPAMVTDAAGNAVACRRYQRIAVCTGASLIQQIVNTKRIAAVQITGPEDQASAWAFGGIPRIRTVGDTPAVIAVHPDLVLARLTNDADRAAANRLRSAGYPVFDPGEVTNLAALEKCYLDLGALLQVRQQVQIQIESIHRRTSLLALHALPQTVSVQLPSAAQEVSVASRLHAALDLAGLSLAGPGIVAKRQLTLAAGALEDPLGSDLLDVATSLRVHAAAAHLMQ